MRVAAAFRKLGQASTSGEEIDWANLQLQLQLQNLNYPPTMAALVNYGSSDEEDNFQEEAPRSNVSFVAVFLGDKLTAQIPGRKTYLLTNYLYEWCQVW